MTANYRIYKWLPHSEKWKYVEAEETRDQAFRRGQKYGNLGWDYKITTAAGDEIYNSKNLSL
jgi:hypothetical protein